MSCQHMATTFWEEQMALLSPGSWNAEEGRTKDIWEEDIPGPETAGMRVHRGPESATEHGTEGRWGSPEAQRSQVRVAGVLHYPLH